MSKKHDSISHKSILLTMSSLVSKVVTLIAGMIIARMLDTVAYATYKQTFLAFNFALPFLSFGLSQGLYYFIPMEKKRVRGRINDCYTIYAIAGIAFALFILLGGNVILSARFNNPQISSLMLWMIPYALLVLMTQCTGVIFNLLDKVKLYMAFSVSCAILTSSSLIVAMMLYNTAKSAVIAVTAAKVIEGVAAILLVQHITPRDDWKPSAASIKEILLFSFPLGINSAIASITKQMDSLMVSSMCYPATYAIYSVGAHELSLIPIFCASVNSAAIPRMRKMIAEGKNRECGELLHKASRRLATILMPIMCFLWVWAEEFILVIYSEKYISAVWIFRVYLLYFLQRIVLSGSVFVSLGMGKYLLIRTIVSCCINALLTVLGIKLFGPIGAAIATELSGWIIFLVSIVPVLSQKLGIPKRMTYPTKLVVQIVSAGMLIGYSVRYLLCEPLVGKFVDWVGLSSRFGLSVTFDHALFWGLSAILFFAAFAPFALLVLKQDYKWLADKFINAWRKYLSPKKHGKPVGENMNAADNEFTEVIDAGDFADKWE